MNFSPHSLYLIMSSLPSLDTHTPLRHPHRTAGTPSALRLDFVPADIHTRVADICFAEDWTKSWRFDFDPPGQKSSAQPGQSPPQRDAVSWHSTMSSAPRCGGHRRDEVQPLCGEAVSSAGTKSSAPRCGGQSPGGAVRCLFL
jgi:hypothetical protein